MKWIEQMHKGDDAVCENSTCESFYSCFGVQLSSDRLQLSIINHFLFGVFIVS